jgi:predicted transcriptional regulator
MATQLLAEVALQHPTRAAIVACVEAAPGLGFRELGRRIGVAPGTLRHHLSVLARSNLVRLESIGARLAVVPAGERRSPAVVACLNEPALAVLRDFVARHGRVHQRQIMAAVPAPRSTTQNRLQRLTSLQALFSERVGRRIYYQATPVSSPAA